MDAKQEYRDIAAGFSLSVVSRHLFYYSKRREDESKGTRSRGVRFVTIIEIVLVCVSKIYVCMRQALRIYVYR